MSVTKVYIVQGESGDFENYNCWNVKAFALRLDATKFVKDAEAWIYVHRLDKKKVASPFDPKVNAGDFDVGYVVRELEVQSDSRE